MNCSEIKENQNNLFFPKLFKLTGDKAPSLDRRTQGTFPMLVTNSVKKSQQIFHYHAILFFVFILSLTWKVSNFGESSSSSQTKDKTFIKTIL